MRRSPQVASALFWATAIGFALALPCQAQPPDDTPRYISSDKQHGIFGLIPERWGGVGVTVLNPADQPTELLSSLYFKTNPDLQFGRRLWLPPHSRRSSWYPVRPPAQPEQDLQALPVVSLLINESGDKETLIKSRLDAMATPSLMPLMRQPQRVIGLISDVDDRLSRQLVKAAFDDVLAREAGRSTPVATKPEARVMELAIDSLPTTPETLQALELIVITSDRVSADIEACIALRQWLHKGGHLWFLSDRVSPATVSLLLGTNCPYTVVDRIELSRWHFQGHTDLEPREHASVIPETVGPGRTKPPDPFDGQIELFASPISMVRVLVPPSQLAMTINGWPAAFAQRAGHGVVLFTTLEAHGWAKPAAAAGTPQQSPPPQPDAFVVGEPLRQAVSVFFNPREEPVLKPEQFNSFLSSQIGYRIVGRGSVLTVLGLFCGFLLASGLCLQRFGKLALLGWIGPCGALVASSLLLALGAASRGAVPPTVASAQFVEVAPGSVDVSLTGMLGFYHQEDSTASIGSEKGGMITPEVEGRSGATRRIVWTDKDSWHWQNLKLSAGLYLIPFETSLRLTEPITARATFGPEGLTGQAELGPFRNAADSLIALPSRKHLAIQMAGDGAFAAGPADQLTAGQFLNSTLPTEEQHRRQLVYEQLLLRHPPQTYPSRPTLLSWTDPVDWGLTHEAGVHQAGSALLAIPLEIQRPPAGTELLIPPGFLPYHSVHKGVGANVLYNAASDEWLPGNTRPTSLMLRFQIPPELLPIRVQRLLLTVDLSAQARTLEILGPDSKVLASRTSPIGSYQIELPHVEDLQPDATGGVTIGVSVGDAALLPGEQKSASEWKINKLHLEIKGVTE